MGEPVQGLLGGGQQVRAVVGGQPGVAGAQAADRRLGRGERRAQVMADRREQRRPPPVGLGHPCRLPGQTAQQNEPRRPGLSRGRGRGRFRGDDSHPVLLAVHR